MKKSVLVIAGVLFGFFCLSAQDLPAYAIYNAEGKPVKWKKMKESLKDSDVVLFGEIHNDPIAHWLQLRLTLALFEINEEKIVLGAEMFETDNQLILDEYLDKFFDDKRFEAGARLWSNYQTDYRPLVLFAREQGIPFIATNIPRRYANMVFRNGFSMLDSLSAEAKQLIAPLPIPYDPDLPGYRNMLQMGMGHSADSENFPRSQAIKDATMAHFILENLEPDHIFIHFNGAYHSDNYEGIVWYLNTYREGLKISTISTVYQADIEEFEDDNLSKADFIIVVPEDMTKTY